MPATCLIDHRTTASTPDETVAPTRPATLEAAATARSSPTRPTAPYSRTARSPGATPRQVRKDEVRRIQPATRAAPEYPVRAANPVHQVFDRAGMKPGRWPGPSAARTGRAAEPGPRCRTVPAGPGRCSESVCWPRGPRMMRGTALEEGTLCCRELPVCRYACLPLARRPGPLCCAAHAV